jgi:parvulin-like peptidyl-prolyl isomerase
MTLRTSRPDRGIRVRFGRMLENEDSKQALITGLFIAAIAATLLILVGAVALSWYNDNLRPLGRVGSVEIGPQMLRDRIKLEQWRINRDESRITQAQIDGSLDAATAEAKMSALDSRAQNLQTTALDELVDVIYQSQLAPGEGVNTDPSQIDAKLATETSGLEQRHVLAIAIEPQAADATNGPTVVERQAALALAQQALADLQSGRDFAEVAKQYGTDARSKAGGDLGIVTTLTISDDEFSNAIFKVELGGTTGIIRGQDDIYRIGRVTEITPGATDAGLRSGLFRDVSEDSVRKLLGYEVASQALNDKITNDALAQTPEQVKLAVLLVKGQATGDPETADGEVSYSEIVYAPNDDLENAPDMDPNDPAWTEAKQQADGAFATLNAITDIAARTTKFGELATSESDSPDSADGGVVDFTTRDLLPDAVGEALFTGTHNKGDLIGPIRGDAAYYVLMFTEKRASVEQRIQAVKDALAVPGANFNDVAKQLGEGPEKDAGGEIGWLTKDQLSSDIAEKVFALSVGQVSDPLELGDGQYFIKLEDKQVRPLDPDQIPSVRGSAFSNWYDTKKTEAQQNGTIDVPGATPADTSGGDLTGGDQGSP